MFILQSVGALNQTDQMGGPDAYKRSDKVGQKRPKEDKRGGAKVAIVSPFVPSVMHPPPYRPERGCEAKCGIAPSVSGGTERGY